MTSTAKSYLGAILAALFVAAVIIATALLSPADQSAKPALPTPEPSPQSAPAAPR